MSMFFEGYWFNLNLTTVIFYIFISGFTIAGNILVCVAFIVDPFKQLQTLQYYYMLSLAVSDLLMGLLAEILLVVAYWVPDSNSVFFAHYLCAIVSGVSSLNNMAALAVVRYFVVKKPLTYHRVITRRRVVVSIVIIWLFSVQFALLPLLGFTTPSYQIYLYGVGCFSPGLALLIAYGGTFKSIRDHTKSLRKTAIAGNMALRNAVTREKATTKTMLIVLGVCIVSWCPFLLLDLIMVQWSQYRTNSFHTARDVALTFTYFSSGVNPLLYTWRVKAFRVAFMKLLGIKKKSNRVSSRTTLCVRPKTIVPQSTGEGDNKICTGPSQMNPISSNNSLKLEVLEQ